jgi:hypothetical protein
MKKNLFFVGILKATDEKSRIRIRIRILTWICKSLVLTHGSGSVSPTRPVLLGPRFRIQDLNQTNVPQSTFRSIRDALKYFFVWA